MKIKRIGHQKIDFGAITPVLPYQSAFIARFRFSIWQPPIDGILTKLYNISVRQVYLVPKCLGQFVESGNIQFRRILLP